MSKFFKWMGWTSFILLVGSLVVGSVLMGVAMDGFHDAGTWQVIVDGDDVSGEVSEWVGTHAHHGPLGWLAGALAMGFTVLVVLPLALMLGIGLPILVMVTVLGGVGLLLAGLSLAALAPFALPLLLVWWVVKRKRPEPAPRA